MQSDDYERLGAFYLGSPVDPETNEVLPTPLLYDSKDLTTHAVLLGMTGSGKTGLAISLLEEASMDGVPVIAIDPKGDLGNLMLTFPNLQGADFRPWVDEAAAVRAGETPDAFAASQAKLWRDGLAQWGQSGERVARLEAAADRVLFTPGSEAGTPLAVLRCLDAPLPGLLNDEEALRERVQSSVSGLLGFLGIAANPLQSREHVLLSTLVLRAWRGGRSLDMATLIHSIQQPPMQRVGIMDVETFFPANERFGLAMRLNNVLAAPGCAAWLEGEPLDIGRMLRAPDGRPRLSIVSIAHLSDSERMFVVTLLLGQLVSWMRAQSGSQSLRAILYMDEIFGYFPPTANPPSKTPMLTLLKQARGYGVGCVLATQNPVDLDYKGLSNCGTWLLGRLQTERDKARVIDGLASASHTIDGPATGINLDRTLSSLSSRTFLLNNIHEDEPLLFRSRWAMSYLAGPLSREQIRRLAMPPALPADALPGPEAQRGLEPARATPETASTSQGSRATVHPVVPREAAERFLPITHSISPQDRVIYRPILLGQVTAHHSNARAGIDEWVTRVIWTPLDADIDGSPWEEARLLACLPELESAPREGAEFGPIPGVAERRTTWAKWSTKLKTSVYRKHPLLLWKSKKPKLVSTLGEEEGAFRGRVSDAVREERDLALEKLRKRYAPKLARLRASVDRALERVDREAEQYRDRKNQTLLSFGATMVGALFGRKLKSARSVRSVASAMKGVSRTSREKADVGRAEARVEEVQQDLADLEVQFREALVGAEERADEAVAAIEVEQLRVSARKADLEVQRLSLVWVPSRVGADGTVELVASLEVGR